MVLCAIGARRQLSVTRGGVPKEKLPWGCWGGASPTTRTAPAWAPAVFIVNEDSGNDTNSSRAGTHLPGEQFVEVSEDDTPPGRDHPVDQRGAIAGPDRP